MCTSPFERVSDLVENWINGNRKDVFRVLADMSPLEAAWYAIETAKALSIGDDLRGSENRGRFRSSDRVLFEKALSRRAL